MQKEEVDIVAVGDTWCEMEDKIANTIKGNQWLDSVPLIGNDLHSN